MKSISISDEKELLLRLQNGDAVAFETLYSRYKEKLASNLFRTLKSWDQTEEILQELFVRIWEHRQNINSDKSFPAYLFSIATNLVNDYFRQVAQDKKLSEQLWLHITSLHSPESLQQQVLADEELMRTIEQLPPQRKIVFKLCKLEGKSYAEVSRMLSISEAAVNDHITKANRFLYQHYDKSLPLWALLITVHMVRGL